MLYAAIGPGSFALAPTGDSAPTPTMQSISFRTLTRTLPTLSPQGLLYSHCAGRVRTRVHMENEPQRGLRGRSHAAQEEADSDDEAELLRMQVPTYAVADPFHEFRLSGCRQYCVKPLHLLLIKRRCAYTVATHRSAVPCLYNIHTICHSCRTSSCRGSNSQQQG